MKLGFLLAAALLVLGTQAKAQDAGCGLGSMIITENTKLMQLLATTTNGATFSQAGGITTGTSGCKAQNFVMREKAVQYFAEVNKDDLSREMAQGQGEKLTTLASLYGCEGGARQDFARAMQTGYDRIIPAADTKVTDMVQNISREVKSNAVLAKGCAVEI